MPGQPVQGQWLSPRVLHFCLSYVTHAIAPARTWAVLKPHVPALLQSCVFPLACFDDADAAQWQDDPHEYIRKVGLCPSPNRACGGVHEVCITGQALRRAWISCG